MKKFKGLTLLLSAAACMMILAGCSSSSSTAQADAGQQETAEAAKTQEAPAAEEAVQTEEAPAAELADELNIYIWSEYVSDEAIEGFEEKYGIEVNVQTFDSMEEGYAKMQSGAGSQYDLIQCNNTFAQGLISQGLVQKLNYDNIPNYANIEDSAKESTYDPNHEYTVPYMGGYSLVIYNKNTCPIELTSFQDLADPKLEDQIVCVTASRTVMGMALAALGYDVNTTEESEVAEATELLKGIKGNIKVFDGDSPSTKLLNGECSVGIIYGGEAAKVMKEMPEDYEIAELESTILGKNDWFIPAGCEHKTEAELFINYICEGEVMAQILDVYPYNNFNTAALEFVSDDYKNNKALNLSEYNVKAAKTTTDLGDADTLYDQYWNEFMAQ